MPIGLGPFPERFGYELAREADTADPLASFRTEFVATDPELIYLDGNSLGRLPLATVPHIADVVSREWGSELISSWGSRWWELARATGDLIAEAIGAPPESIVVADSTSVALFKLAWGALSTRSGGVLTDDLNFPTDLYILRAAAEAGGGRTVDVVRSANGIDAPVDGLLNSLSDATALLSLSHVAFKSGYLYDVDLLTAAAHEVGALALWDLSHSAGVVPIDLGNIDLAVGCTYKYLNGGPGSPAFLYVNPDIQIQNPLAGWWGHEAPFAFELDHRPAASIARFQTGTMPILSLSAIEPGVRMTIDAGVESIRTKSIALTDYLIYLADRVLAPLGFEIASPRDPARRGSHVSLRHPDAWRISQAMIDAAKVVPDFREPDNLRLGLAPLYIRFLDVHTAVHRMVEVADPSILDGYSNRRGSIT